MTAHAMKGDRERCLEAGMDSYISKPVRAPVLHQTLKAISEQSEHVSAAESQSPPAASSELPPHKLNWDEALHAVGGDADLLREVMDAFLMETEELIGQLKELIEQQNAAEIRRLAHTIKGSLRMFGESEALVRAERLEQLAKQDDLGEAPQRWNSSRRNGTACFPKWPRSSTAN